MTFNPAKAYHDDWRYQDWIEETSWIKKGEAGEDAKNGFKARWGDFDTSDLINLAAGISFDSDAAAVVLWEPKPDDVSLDDWTPQFDPKRGQILRRDDRDGERWMIMSFKQTRFGHWLIACEKAPINVAND